MSRDPRSRQGSPAAAALGREVIRVERDSGRVLLRFHAPPAFANRHGTVSGGFLAAMLDSAASGPLIVAAADAGLTAVTSELDVRFLRPAPPGEILAEARLLERQPKSIRTEAQLTTAAGTVLARAIAEFRLIPR